MMSSFWGGKGDGGKGHKGGGGKGGKGNRVRHVPAGDIQMIKDISAGNLTDAGARKLLLSCDGSVEAAVNAYFQVAERGSEALEELNEGGRESEEGTFPVTIAPGASSFPGVLEWLEAQCSSLGCPLTFKSSSASSTSSSLTSPTEDTSSPEIQAGVLNGKIAASPEDLIKSETPVKVSIHAGLFQHLVSRERGSLRESHLSCLESTMEKVAGCPAMLHLDPYQPSPPLPDGTSAENCARTVYQVSIPYSDDGSGPLWLVPTALLVPEAPRTKSPSVDTLTVTPPKDSRNEPILRTVAKVAATKVFCFQRYGELDEDETNTIISCLQSRFPDTQIFHRAEGTRHTFVSCGLGGPWAKQWFMGRVVYPIHDAKRIFQGEGFTILKSHVLRTTGCTIAQCRKRRREGCDDSSFLGVIGPHSRRGTAVALVEGQRNIQEVVVRIPPTLEEVLEAKIPDIEAHVDCRVQYEEGGRVRLIGQKKGIDEARVAIEAILNLYAREVQRPRLQEVSKSLLETLLRVEVKLPLPPEVRHLLSQPSTTESLKKRSRTLPGGMRARAPDVIQGRVTVLWSNVDNFVDEIQRDMQKAGVLPPNETLHVGSVALGVLEGDEVAKGKSWEAAPTRDIFRELGRFSPFMDNNNTPHTHGKVVRVEPGVQTNTQDIQSTVSDWLRSTHDPSRADPGRPTCDILTIEWEMEEGDKKPTTTTVACPGTKMLTLVKAKAKPESLEERVIDVVRNLLRIFYLESADEFLLEELRHALEKSENSEFTRNQHSVLDRCRQRCREMLREARMLPAALQEEIQKLIAEAQSPGIQQLLRDMSAHTERIMQTWMQTCQLGEWEIEKRLRKSRNLLEEAERVERWERGCWELLQSIAESTGAFVDYYPPNNYLHVSGHEPNVRAAVQQLQQIMTIGARGLDIQATVRLPEAVAQSLAANDSFMLQFVERHARLHSAEIGQDGTLVLRGTKKQIEDVLVYLSLSPDDVAWEGKQDDRPGMMKPSPSMEWGRSGSPCPMDVDNETTCSACLMDEYDGDTDLIVLLCGHRVHAACLRANIKARHGMAGEEGRYTKEAGRCPGEGCRHVLTVGEYNRIVDPSVPSVVENLHNRVEEHMQTHDKVRPCPKCSSWVVAGLVTEPLTCLNCGTRFCGQRNTRCGGEPHYFSTCEQYFQSKTAMLRRRGCETEAAEAEATGSLPTSVVLCARCPAWILREDDKGDDRCRYMKCRQCGYEFCWLCLTPAIDHRHINPDNPTETAECTPDKREERRVKLMKAHEVPLWKGYTQCDRCLRMGNDEMFGCLQCLNSLLCNKCEPKGCIGGEGHVVAPLPMEDAPETRRQSKDILCPNGHKLEQSNGLRNLRCNNCNNPNETDFYGCRDCNYDLCRTCIAAKKPSRASGEVLLSPSKLELDDKFWIETLKLGDITPEEFRRRTPPQPIPSTKQQPQRILFDWMTGSLHPVSRGGGLPFVNLGRGSGFPGGIGGSILAAMIGGGLSEM